MKKVVLSIVIAAMAVIALGSASFVYAQATTPPAAVPGSGYGYGMGGQGMRGGMMNQNNARTTQDGILHEAMIAVYAEKLGLTEEELDTRLENGETIAQIASAQGLTAEQFIALKADARSQALDQAAQDGTLTQEQADWLKQRGSGMAAGGRGMRGAGMGRNANPDCPYYPQAQP